MYISATSGVAKGESGGTYPGAQPFLRFCL